MAGFVDLYLAPNGQNFERCGARQSSTTTRRSRRARSRPPVAPPTDGGTLVAVSLGVPLANAFAPSCCAGNVEVSGTADEAGLPTRHGSLR